MNKKLAISGVVYASLLRDVVMCSETCELEGLLLGSIHTVKSVVRKDSSEQSSEETVISVDSYVITGKSSSFYDVAGFVDCNLLRTRAHVDCDKAIVGWFRFQRGQALVASARDKSVHESFQMWHSSMVGASPLVSLGGAKKKKQPRRRSRGKSNVDQTETLISPVSTPTQGIAALVIPPTPVACDPGNVVCMLVSYGTDSGACTHTLQLAARVLVHNDWKPVPVNILTAHVSSEQLYAEVAHAASGTHELNAVFAQLPSGLLSSQTTSEESPLVLETKTLFANVVHQMRTSSLENLQLEREVRSLQEDLIRLHLQMSAVMSPHGRTSA
eukprot:TRINITY_DN14987_c0_g1_i1.p1 TRINITY_DN14987_c0_g1~~TRINITY_DN14987_c0_g1_i1.p1  ORF type:complete len:329 (+),score=65.48 TRINITY_DN14987_c0_g1_i1:92-1078(+)